MTAVDERPHTDVVEPVPEPHGAAAAPAVGQQEREPGAIAAVGWSVVLLAAILLGFGAYLFVFSSAQEARSQSTLYKTFRNELSKAIAPTGPTDQGAPVAILDIPQAGLSRAVVVEGTTGGDLTMGPGHRMDSGLPGQAGVSVVYGRSVTFGGPFDRISDLQIGDTFRVTTGNGVAKFRVTGYDSDPLPSNGIVLSTAEGEWHPGTSRTVIAELTSKPLARPARGTIPDSHLPLQSDPDAVLPLMLWSVALAGVAFGATFARHRWATWPAYVCALPVALAVLWNVYENAAQLLPNLY